MKRFISFIAISLVAVLSFAQSKNYNTGYQYYGTSRSYTDVAPALTSITNAISGWGECRVGCITENGSGAVIYGDNGYSYKNINTTLANKIKAYNSNKWRISCITLTNSGYYCIVYKDNGYYGNFPKDMSSKMNEFNSNKETIRSVSISENGDYVIVTDQHYSASNDTDFSNMKSASNMFGSIKSCSVTNKGIVVVCENGVYYNNIPSNLAEKIRTIDYIPDNITFTDSGTYLITNNSGTYSYHM